MTDLPGDGPSSPGGDEDRSAAVHRGHRGRTRAGGGCAVVSPPGLARRTFSRYTRRTCQDCPRCPAAPPEHPKPAPRSPWVLTGLGSTVRPGDFPSPAPGVVRQFPRPCRPVERIPGRERQLALAERPADRADVLPVLRGVRVVRRIEEQEVGVRSFESPCG